MDCPHLPVLRQHPVARPHVLHTGIHSHKRELGGGLLTFSHFNYASAGDFGTIGFAAGNDTIMALYECVPLDHILMQTSSAGTLRNITLSLPVAITANVTNAEAWNWSNATHLLHITAPIGIANIYIRFVGRNYAHRLLCPAVVH